MIYFLGSSMDSSYVNKWRNRARPNQGSNANTNSGSKYNFNQKPASKKEKRVSNGFNKILSLSK